MSKKKNKKEKLADKDPEKSLTKPLKKSGGRSNSGRVSVRYKGGGAKRLYRIIGTDEELPFEAEVKAIEYDPNRTCFIALIVLENGKKAYVLAPQDLKMGDKIKVGEGADLEKGNRKKLKDLPTGTKVFNVEIEPGRGGNVAKSAGTFCEVLSHEGKYTVLEFPSGEEKKVLSECWATIGQASNPQHRFEQDKKAGDSRHKGKRPSVRGVAMAVDHPHAGGEGRTGTGGHPKTKWGKPAHGKKTRKSKWTDKLIVKSRHEKKKEKKKKK